MGEEDEKRQFGIPERMMKALERRAEQDGDSLNQVLFEAIALYLLIREHDDRGLAFGFLSKEMAERLEPANVDSLVQAIHKAVDTDGGQLN